MGTISTLDGKSVDNETGVNNQPRYKYLKRNNNLRKIDKSTILKSSITAVDRVISSVLYPEMKILDISDVYVLNNNEKPSHMIIMEHFRNEGRLHNACIERILIDAENIFKTESTLVELEIQDNDTINICGDIHGQYYDLLNLFNIAGGLPPKEKYLFLGDYVDRGSFSLECILLLFTLKINYPKSIYLLRGNHESRRMTEIFTFRNEIKMKLVKDNNKNNYYYNTNDDDNENDHFFILYNHFMKAFDTLPLAALINSDVLCMHGGLSPNIKYINDITKINRYCEPPIYGTMCDILWSDPLPNYNNDMNKPLYRNNLIRKCSYYFTYTACMEFIKRNKLLTIIRAHEVKQNGYEFYKEIQDTNIPSLITIFSAPSYLDVFNNYGSILIYNSNKLMNIKQFQQSPHPFYLPNFIDTINFSIPFIIEQTTKFWWYILRLSDDSNNNENDSNVNKNFIGSAGIGSDSGGGGSGSVGVGINQQINKQKYNNNNDHNSNIINKKLIALSKKTDTLSNKRKSLENSISLKGLQTSQLIDIDENMIENIKIGNIDYDQIHEIDLQNEQNPGIKDDDGNEQQQHNNNNNNKKKSTKKHR